MRERLEPRSLRCWFVCSSYWNHATGLHYVKYYFRGKIGHGKIA